jgi:hypothetical protein
MNRGLFIGPVMSTITLRAMGQVHVDRDLNPFTITDSDQVAVAVATLAGAQVEVVPRGHS